MRSLCHRPGETLPSVSVVQTLGGTWGIKRFQASRVRWALDGVEPVFCAFFVAFLRRSLTIASGTRDAMRHEPARSFSPKQRERSRSCPSTVVSHCARSTGCPRPAAVVKSGV